MTQWNCKTVSQPNCPNIHISRLAELPAIAAHGSQAVSKVVIHAKFKLPGIHRRQRIVGEFSCVEWLQARHELRSAHRVLPERDLAQTVSRFNPVTTSMRRPLIFSTDVQRHSGRLPGAVETERVRAVVLQQMLK